MFYDEAACAVNGARPGPNAAKRGRPARHRDLRALADRAYKAGMNRNLATLMSTAALVSMLAGEALATDKTSASDLPGVQSRAPDPSAHHPLPEPEDAMRVGDRPGTMRVGNWDIRISGSVSYEISTGNAAVGPR